LIFSRFSKSGLAKQTTEHSVKSSQILSLSLFLCYRE